MYKFYFMCMSVVLAYTHVHYMHARCLWSPEEELRFLGTSAIDDCESRSSARATGAFNLSPSLGIFFEV